MEDRWAEVKRFISEWYRPLQEGDGYSEEEVQEAEVRLGIKFPDALRELYLLFGKRDEIVWTYNVLQPLDRLRIVQGHLVFWEENQEVYNWCIKPEDMSLPNPKTYCFSVHQNAFYQDTLQPMFEGLGHSLTDEVLWIIARNLMEMGLPSATRDQELGIWVDLDEAESEKLKRLSSKTSYEVLNACGFYQYKNILVWDSGMLFSMITQKEEDILDFIKEFDLEDRIEF
jgi:hypothetical protein